MTLEEFNRYYSDGLSTVALKIKSPNLTWYGKPCSYIHSSDDFVTVKVESDSITYDLTLPWGQVELVKITA